MIQKQVVINNDVYDCDIDVTVDEWKKILEDKKIKANNYIDMLIKFYNEPEHKSTCKAIGEKYNISPQSPNSIITNFAKAAQKILNRFEVISTEGKPTYWIIPMTGKYIENNNFEWTMRPELVQAIEEQGIFYVENREDVKENLMKLFSYMRNGNEDEIKFAKDLIKYGNNFAIELIDGEYLFGPSRFIGYKKNSYESHIQDQGHGSYTDSKLKRIYKTIAKGNDTHSSYIDMFKDICSKYSIERNFDSVNSIYIPEQYLNSSEVIIKKNDMKDINTIINILNSKRQIILQGAPGTGKTFITAEIAVALCDGVDNILSTRKDIMERYNKLVDEERIAFTTFHQSMDYEEFIEGIKPKVDNVSNEMIYEPQAGMFKKMCEKAIKPIVQDEKFQIDDKATVWKVSLAKTGENEIRTDCLNNNRIRIGWDHYGENLKYEELEEGKIVLNAFINKMQIGDVVFSCYSEKVIDAIGIVEGEYEWDETLTDGYKRVRKVNWIVKNIKENIYELNNKTKMTLSTVYRLNNISINKVLELIKKYNNNQAIEENDKPYVLIIDEINRGNISKIFGELITLLEVDKRVGGVNKLEATLPYSNEKFSIPSNLYIIGTMNTADRSLGYIDYAVRRRFAFYTLKAEKSVIENYYQNKEVLRNRAIKLFEDVEYLISTNIASEFNVEDLMIGHSYFLVKDEEELDSKLEYEIKPLLREYAFDGILDKLKKVDGKYKEIENLGKVSNISDNYQDDSENGED